LKRCHRCGRELQESLSFCPFCGAPMQEASRRLRYIDEDEEQDTIILNVARERLASGPAGEFGDVTARIEVRGPSGGLIQTVNLGPQVFAIGRGSDQDIRVIDHTASRNHAEIHWDNGAFFVRDVGSINGSLLNGEPLEGEVELTDQDIIGIGKHSLVFCNSV